MKTVFSIAAIATASLALTSPAQGTTFSFVHISAQGGDAPNSSFANQTAQQLFVDVTDEGGGDVRFTFRNDGPLASSINALYFDGGNLIGISSIIDGPGTAYSQGATPPNLPGGNSMTIPFSVTPGLLADADNPAPHNGANPGEWVAIIASLGAGSSYAGVIDDINSGRLRMGLHVIAQEDGESDAFVNGGDGHNTPVIPLPAGAGLALAGLAPLAFRRRRTL
jgi:hypothetical protein